MKLKMKMLRWALKLGFLKDHRRQIGIWIFVAGAAIEFLTDRNLVGICSESTTGLCGMLAKAQPWLLGAGTYAASLGQLFRKDAKGKPKS